MAKFKVVKEKPDSVKKGEYVIDHTSFLTEIDQHKTKATKNGLTGHHHLRSILESIASTYDPENMTAFSVKVHNFEGIPYKNSEELNNLLLNMLKSDYPQVFIKYIENKIKNRPYGTTMVYYVDSGVKGAYELFYRHGLSDINDIETETNKKTGKTVGKPAITNEQAELLKQQ